jgi:hypothetical protein
MDSDVLITEFKDCQIWSWALEDLDQFLAVVVYDDGHITSYIESMEDEDE